MCYARTIFDADVQDHGKIYKHKSKPILLFELTTSSMIKNKCVVIHGLYQCLLKFCSFLYGVGLSTKTKVSCFPCNYSSLHRLGISIMVLSLHIKKNGWAMYPFRTSFHLNDFEMNGLFRI